MTEKILAMLVHVVAATLGYKLSKKMLDKISSDEGLQKTLKMLDASNVNAINKAITGAVEKYVDVGTQT